MSFRKGIMRLYNSDSHVSLHTLTNCKNTYNSSDFFEYSTTHLYFGSNELYILYIKIVKIYISDKIVFLTPFDGQFSISNSLLTLAPQSKSFTFNNTTSSVTNRLWSITTITKRNHQVARTVMSLNKSWSTFFPPLLELANWLAVELTLFDWCLRLRCFIEIYLLPRRK